MLINTLCRLFREYIFSPHVHDWKFDRTVRTYTNAMGLEAEIDNIVYKCACGKVKVVPCTTPS